jgi:hypothetical protein
MSTRERELMDDIGGLLSWIGQTTPAEFVAFLKASQPDLFGDWPAENMEEKLRAVIGNAWNSLANPEYRTARR